MTEKSMTAERTIATGCRVLAEHQLHTRSFLNASPEEWSESLKAIINKLWRK